MPRSGDPRPRELFEAKWTEVPGSRDAVNLEFVRAAIGTSRVAAAAIVCRARNAFPLCDGIHAVPVSDLG